MFTEDQLLPLSALQHLIFCERQCALIHVEGAWTDNRFTVQGSHMHQRVHEREDESRGNVRTCRGLPLRSLKLGLSGIADVVEFHRVDEPLADDPLDWLEDDDDDRSTPAGIEHTTPVALTDVDGLWRPFPVEHKRGKPKPDACDEVQLCAQAVCLEEMLDCQIGAGAMFYGATRRRLDLPFNDELRRTTQDAACRLHELVDAGKTPPAVYEKKCRSCSLVDVCMPKTAAAGRSAVQYLEDALS